MPFSLTEAETAAYLNPSQENLAVYVKSLEKALEEAGDLTEELAAMREELEAAPGLGGRVGLQSRVTELEDELDALRGAGK